MLFSKNKKGFITIFLIVFLFTSSIGILSPKEAKAVPVEDILGAPIAASEWVWAKLEKVFGKAFSEIMSVAFKRTLQMYMETLAYNAATFITERAPGGKPTFQQKSWKSYMQDAGDAATSEFLDSVASSADIGLDICQPPGGIDLQFNVGLGIASQDKPKPRCSLNSNKGVLLIIFLASSALSTPGSSTIKRWISPI